MSNDNSVIARISSFIKRKTSQKYRFNLQYSGTYWDGLKNIEDLGRYSLLIGYTRFFFPGARILDLGCGNGVLHDRFNITDYAQYTGVDISDVAISHAQKNTNEKTRFVVDDLDNLDMDGMFDVIIYNESIYYLKKPIDSIRGMFKNLSEKGIIIFSNFNKHNKERLDLWNNLTSILELQDRQTITNGKGDSWTVHVYKIKLPPHTSHSTPA